MLEKLIAYALARMQERSTTWPGLALIAGAVASLASDDSATQQRVVDFAVLIAGALAAGSPDRHSRG